MQPRFLALPLAFAALAWGANALALPIAIGSSINLIAISDAGAGPFTDTDTDSQGATTNPLTATVQELATNGAASVNTTATATAAWTNTAMGTVQFTNVGWTTANISNGAADLTAGTDWQYTFTADATGLFTMNWNITGAGSDLFGLNGFNFDWSGGGAFFDVNTSGSTTRAIVAGNTYTVGLENQANLSGALGTRDAHMNGTFDWSMDAGPAAPEPSILALMGLGLALLSFRRRRVAA